MKPLSCCFWLRQCQTCCKTKSNSPGTFTPEADHMCCATCRCMTCLGLRRSAVAGSGRAAVRASSFSTTSYFYFYDRAFRDVLVLPSICCGCRCKRPWCGSPTKHDFTFSDLICVGIGCARCLLCIEAMGGTGQGGGPPSLAGYSYHTGPHRTVVYPRIRSCFWVFQPGC